MKIAYKHSLVMAVWAVLLTLMTALTVQAAGGNLITGGRGVGPVRLGQNLNQVRALLGAPTKVVASPNDPNSQLLHYKKQGLAVFMGSSGGVIGVTVMGGNWATPEGIRVGSTGSQVKAAYGIGLQRGQGNVSYASRGLAFSLRGGKVTSIYVVKVEENKALLGDRIIVPGVRVGSLKIGMPIVTVNEAWGKADKVLPMGQGGRQLHRYKEEAVGLIVSQGRVEGMVLETGDFITPKGVKVGSSRAEVVKVYGQGAQDGQRLVYERAGIGFLFTAGRVQQITVLRASGR